MKRVLLAILGLAAGALSAGEPVTKMSPYEVRANSVEFKDWIKVGSPHFILYTDARSKEATQVLRELEMLHFAGQIVFGRVASKFGPTIVILPTASSDWKKLESKGAGIEWKSAAVAVGGDVVDLVVLQHDWQSDGLSLLRAIFAHIDLSRMDIHGPFWFNRGLSEIYETADFDGDHVMLGHISPRVWELKQRNWLPWGRFFEVTSSSPEFTRENMVGLYEAQVSVFTQYLITNPDRAWMGRLVGWVEYLNTGAPPTEERFVSYFGQDWETWTQTLERYLRSGHYEMFNVTTPAKITQYQETKFDLPRKEIRELFILTQTLLQKVPESEASLDALLAVGLKSECLRELLVEACLEWKRKPAALESVRQLIAAGSTNARVYRQGDALLTSKAGAFGPAYRLGPELAEVRAWDRRGLELEPLYAELNDSCAVNEAGAPEVDQQSITTIEQCYARTKGRASTDRVLAALALALWRIGDTTTARELTTRLKQDPLVQKKVREMAGQLLEMHPPEKETSRAAKAPSAGPVVH